MTSEAETRFLKEFGPRVAELLDRLQKAAGVRELRTMADLDILAAHPPNPRPESGPTLSPFHCGHH
jgi:hypothetical protein